MKGYDECDKVNQAKGKTSPLTQTRRGLPQWLANERVRYELTRS